MKRLLHLLGLGLCILPVIGQDLEQTHYKQGIALTFSGTKGEDYMEEYFYHDKVTFDKKVTYIKAATTITMAHTALNSVGYLSASRYYQIVGADGPNDILGDTDDGIIRFKVDRDLSPVWRWRANDGGSNTLRAYSDPLSFATLTYEDGTTAVLGATGGNGQAITSKTTYYHRGIVDDFGDEWHTITVGDDDAAYVSSTGQGSVSYYGSDGRVHLFVVNPKTPGMTVRATGDAQFYTTPPKAYFVPKIHAQTTYFNAGTGTVTFEIRDLNGNNVFYRIGGGSFIDAGADNVTLDQDDFSAGSNTLQYYYAGNAAYTKTRTVIKNPTHPSLAETHGNIAWDNSTEYAKIAGRLNRAPYSTEWNRIKEQNSYLQYDTWNATNGLGARWRWGVSNGSVETGPTLNNTFCALVLGWNTVSTNANAGGKSFGAYAKEMLLDSILSLDPVAWELSHSNSAAATPELRGAGYEVFRVAVSHAIAYDIFAANFRSNQVSGGMTAVEDYFVRDMLASAAMKEMQYHGGWTATSPQMWGSSTAVGGLACGLVMPTYNTPYYGTSGYDGTTSATYAWTPYPDFPKSWKDLWTDINLPAGDYPNQKYFFGPDRDESSYDLLVDSGPNLGYWEGSNLGYWDRMNPPYSALLNLTYRNTAKTWPIIDQAMLYSVDTGQRASGGTGTPSVKQRPQVYNELNPIPGAVGLPKFLAQSASTQAGSLTGVYSMLWFDDEADFSGEPDPPVPPNAPTGLNVTATGLGLLEATWTDASTDEDGFNVEISPDQSAWQAVTTTAANATSAEATGLLSNTLYYIRVRSFSAAGGTSAWVEDSATTQTPETPAAGRRPGGKGRAATIDQ